MPSSSWPDFRVQHDLLGASHRGLQRHLIPGWLSASAGLTDKIESSAYGETPPALVQRMFEAMGASAGELFLDLGCGGGNVCALAAERGLRAIGIERNPELLAAARSYLESLDSGHRIELRSGDFSEQAWPRAALAYATTARFPKAQLEALARKADASPSLRAFGCLGRPLPLPPPTWTETSLGKHPVVWNDGEAVLEESLYLYRRSTSL